MSQKTPNSLKGEECNLTECCFNSHSNLLFDEFGDPIGPHFCTAETEEEIYEEQGFGVPDECPIFYGGKIEEASES